jgi:hypothetical protein
MLNWLNWRPGNTGKPNYNSHQYIIKNLSYRKFAYFRHVVTGKPGSLLQPMSQSLAKIQAEADSVNNARAEAILVKSIAKGKDW